MSMKMITAVVGTLALASGIAFAGEGEAQKTAFNDLDQNQDGVITQSEASADQELVAQFATADANQDGYLTPSEFEALEGEMEEAE
jgi:Ca2+-binding EF-hand superfamily protein